MGIPIDFNRMGTSPNTPLTFTANTAGSTVQLTQNGSPDAVEIVVSKNDGAWEAYTIGTTITLAAAGDTVRFWNHNSTFSKSGGNYYRFVMSGSIAASGNVDSMINYGALTRYCYAYMFGSCTSLTTPPELPATTLAAYCYMSMFNFCIGLTTPPELPATTLAEYCYYMMFYYCSKLTTAPALKATTLVSHCYGSMFESCSKLTSVTVSFTSFNSAYTLGWLVSVASTGTFYCPTALGTDSTITRGTDYCPTNWTVVNTD